MSLPEVHALCEHWATMPPTHHGVAQIVQLIKAWMGVKEEAAPVKGKPSTPEPDLGELLKMFTTGNF